MAPSATEIPIVASKTEVEYSSGNPELSFPTEAPKGPLVFEDKYEERAYLKQRLALAFRVFAKFGFSEGVAGHITLRDPVDPESFWVNPFGMHFSLVTADDLILVDHTGKVVDSGKNRIIGMW
ncbi:Meiotically up-regulated protein 14 protein [Lachnellula occidentalis]|uniref:Meiotically up-regulated protein 14 protein n=1 Tax=Lachnellula occidentalis TaxID=215460 RepID=A0A8H8UJW7_9HELO|nr:Meiotically up-regulated protein 14 protein [Lachnellula occidentalis]